MRAALPFAGVSFDGGDQLTRSSKKHKKRDSHDAQPRTLVPRYSNPDAIAAIADIFGCTELSVAGSFQTKSTSVNALIRLRNNSNEKCNDMADDGWHSRFPYENMISSLK